MLSARASQAQRFLRGRIGQAGALVVAAGLLASCSASGPAPSEGFSQAQYGKSSPRVVADNRPVPQGGGRYMVGDAYRVAGRTYIPQDNPTGYTATGLASWYGSGFHGRKTANGEVYDMRGLSAAHPTLPLPSYARVTNLSNGRSVVVRVNDRGPFSRGRVIDVSSQAASMLDFKRAGVARVQVDYLGRARLDGHDRDMLMASYRGPGGTPPRTMFASRSAPQPTVVASTMTPRPTPVDFSIADDHPAQPDPASAGSLSDPLGPLILRTGFASSYAETPIKVLTPAEVAANALATNATFDNAAAAPARRLPAPAVVQLGTFSDPANADRIAGAFRAMGDVAVTEQARDGRTLRVVRVMVGDPSVSPQSVIAAARKYGLSGAFVLSASD